MGPVGANSESAEAEEDQLLEGCMQKEVMQENAHNVATLND